MNYSKCFLIGMLMMGGGLLSCAHAGGEEMVIFETTLGEITIELYAEQAPITVENFIGYVESGFYDDTLFHRVIPGFVVQGGGFASGLNRKETRAAIENEATNGLENLRGTLSMARTNEVNSATSQFFINLVDNAFLNHRDTTPEGYGDAVFGRVVEGFDIVESIASQPTTTVGFFSDVPVDEIKILSARVQ